jgi:hypothetical protein
MGVDKGSKPLTRRSLKKLSLASSRGSRIYTAPQMPFVHIGTTKRLEKTLGWCRDRWSLLKSSVLLYKPGDPAHAKYTSKRRAYTTRSTVIIPTHGVNFPAAIARFSRCTAPRTRKTARLSRTPPTSVDASPGYGDRKHDVVGGAGRARR